MNGEGVADLTAPGSSGTHVLTGYAVKLNDGTVAVYSDKKLTKLVDSYSYDKNIWNVEDVSAGTNASRRRFLHRRCEGDCPGSGCRREHGPRRVHQERPGRH